MRKQNLHKKSAFSLLQKEQNFIPQSKCYFQNEDEKSEGSDSYSDNEQDAETEELTNQQLLNQAIKRQQED